MILLADDTIVWNTYWCSVSRENCLAYSSQTVLVMGCDHVCSAAVHCWLAEHSANTATWRTNPECVWKKHQIEFVSLLRFGIPFASNADVERVAVEKPVDAVPAAAPYSAMRTFRCPSVAVAFCDSRLRWALFSNAKTTAASHFSDPLDARPSAEFARGSRPTTLHPVDHALRAPYANVPPRPRPLVLQCAWCVWGVWYVWCVCASTYPPFSSAFPALYAPWGPAIVNLLALF